MASREQRTVNAGASGREDRLRVQSYDGLRAIAILGVFGYHIAGRRMLPGGWFGVDLFFGLSGFLITSILLSEFRSRQRIAIKAFFARRFLRLAPALLFFVAIMYPVALLAGIEVDPFGWLAALTYTTDIYGPISGYEGVFAQTWSLSVEEQFYLFWPFCIVAMVRVPRKFWWAIGAVAVISTVLSALLWFARENAAYQSPFPHLPTLFLGALLAAAFSGESRAVERVVRSHAVPVVAALVFAAVMLLAGQYDPFWYFGGKAMAAIPLVLLIGYVSVRRSGYVERFLSLRPLTWLGRRSYGLYLWHYPVIWLISTYFVQKWLVVVTSIALSLVATEVSWRLVERPCLRLKRRFERGAVQVTS